MFLLITSRTIKEAQKNVAIYVEMELNKEIIKSTYNTSLSIGQFVGSLNRKAFLKFLGTSLKRTNKMKQFGLNTTQFRQPSAFSSISIKTPESLRISRLKMLLCTRKGSLTRRIMLSVKVTWVKLLNPTKHLTLT
jgi:hypothetical protein